MRTTLLLVAWGLPALAAGPIVTMNPAGYPNRQIESALEHQEKLVTQDPKNPESWYTLAALYSEKAKVPSLPRGMAKNYVMRGLEVDEWALILNPVYYEALTLKNILLRQRAVYENDPAVRRRLIAEADAAKAKAAELLRKYGGGGKEEVGRPS